MPLTKDFKTTVQERVKRDFSFRREMMRGALELLLSGDLDTAKLVLRDFVNATLGFEALGKAVNRSPKSLMRMLSSSGNPTAKSLLEILTVLQKREKMRFKVVPSRAA